MKPLLAILLFTLLSFQSHAQATWPRNPKTGKIEFGGQRDWPSAIATDSARQILAWHWYVAKLTTASQKHVEQRNAEAVSSALLTYAGLPVVVGITEGSFYINCVVELMDFDSQFCYYLHDFTISDLHSKILPRPIESRITSTNKNEQAALAALRKRLAAALAGW